MCLKIPKIFVKKVEYVWLFLIMILFIISFIALIYSLTVQTFRAIKNLLTPAHKKTPEYQEFLKELDDILTNHKVDKISNSIF